MKREIEFAATGYGRYYWRAFLDGVSGTYFTEAIVPVILREDPAITRSVMAACEASLSNLYYPPQERGPHQTLRDWGHADGIGSVK